MSNRPRKSKKAPRAPQRPRPPRPASDPPERVVEHGGALRALVTTATDAGVDPAVRLQASRSITEAAELVEGVAWLELRSEGLSWRDLGELAGISRSGAQQRHASLTARI